MVLEGDYVARSSRVGVVLAREDTVHVPAASACYEPVAGKLAASAVVGL